MRAKYHEIDKKDQAVRGQRIREIRENELKFNKSQMAIELGISPQFLTLVEDGRANLAYRSLRKLKRISGHSTDYILFGLDDETIKITNRYLENYSEAEIINAIEVLKNISLYIKNDENLN